MKSLPGDPDYNPLYELPQEFRHAVSYFWTFHSSILNNMTCLCIRLKTWIARDGLTIEDLKPVLNKLTTPEECSNIIYPTDLLNRLAANVATVLRHKRAIEQSAKNRQELQDRNNNQQSEEQISFLEMFRNRLASNADINNL